MTLREANHCCNFPTRKATGAQLKHYLGLFFGRPNASNPFTEYTPVLYVACASIPPEVRKDIVRFVSVVMARFHTYRALALKGFKYQTMNVSSKLFLIFSQRYFRVAVLVNVLQKISLWDRGTRWEDSIQATIPEIASYIPPVTYFISRESRDFFPLLGGWGILIIAHGLNLLHGFRLWEEPGQCSRTASGSFYYTAMVQ